MAATNPSQILMSTTSTMVPQPTSLVFTVRRCEPELVKPARPTPRELKLLSDIDDQECLRTQIPIIQFYKYNPSMQGKDPAKVIREALGKTLVFYYPFAGRLREGPNGKLMVDCTGDGVLFIEADADVKLEQFGEALQPPFPCLDQLLYDVPGSGEILNCPLLLIQVTTMKCGGIIFALRLNHTMADGAGLFQFISAMAEMAQGAISPSILPVWERHLLSCRTPPQVTCTHHEYDKVDDIKSCTNFTPLENMVHRSFFFNPSDITAIRRFVPSHLRHCSTFEVLTACLWRYRTLALQFDPDEQVRLLCIVNVRSKFNPPLPKGYYGNAIVYPVAVTTAGKLCQNPLGYAIELVKQTKKSVTEEYVKSVADFLATKGRPPVSLVRVYLVSDARHAKFSDVDFGWGKAMYGGPAKGVVASFQIPHRNKKGENGLVVPIYLPASAMERFVRELNRMLKDHPAGSRSNSTFIKSTM
ncbi:Benzoyl coenzyme A: Benzyl alcohol benzoyl transferase, putative [Theobroma cacao]|uniref:Benzoyl coenzyme A: Benzyl alcohol benzoyl transferase, putative n=1 Tax=Theobroma cacao TaxID=3641 RepID=A0A061F710_THECC|nr:Benzoyl coenzyme A: Benzyl alcohol benzoyl transferase, putative [Theobroma cacao]